jgi:retinol dehydrogenase 12
MLILTYRHPTLTSLSNQGHDLFLATHCFGPFVLTRLLHPLLSSTAASSPAASVRVLWAGSIVTEFPAAKKVMDLDNLDYKRKDESQADRYAISKTGSVFIGTEWAKQDAGSGIVHLVRLSALSCHGKLTDMGKVVNPGNLKTPLQRNMSSFQRMAVVRIHSVSTGILSTQI